MYTVDYSYMNYIYKIYRMTLAVFPTIKIQRFTSFPLIFSYLDYCLSPSAHDRYWELFDPFCIGR